MITKIEIECADEFSLIGTLYRPKKTNAAVMIASATGIKQSFYKVFSTFLYEHGYGVITYDNRGIGDSRQEPINEVGASLINWGQLDMTAVLKELKKQFPGCTYHLIGHSAGGQLSGLMKNAMELDSMFNIACSSGSLKYMKYPFKLKAFFWLNIVIPINNFIFGHTKSNWFGMGEPLPKKVGDQWQKWCNVTGYVECELGNSVTEHSYNKLNIPSQWLYSIDDGIANRKNVKDIIRVYTHLNYEIIELNPQEEGFDAIGHMGFFYKGRESLWRYAIRWLDNNSIKNISTSQHSN